MNLADAIRQAAQQSSGLTYIHQAQTIAEEPFGGEPVMEVIESHGPLVPQASSAPEAPSTMVTAGNVVRLELFLAPEQLGSLFKAVVSSQHTVMTLREAANFLRIPSGTLDQMAQDREIPAFQVDGKWRFSRATLEEWLTLRTAQTGQEA